MKVKKKKPINKASPNSDMQSHTEFFILICSIHIIFIQTSFHEYVKPQMFFVVAMYCQQLHK